MGSGADTNGCGLCRPLSLKEVEFWDERGGFLLDLPTTPWVDPQFTESYQRLGFVFFRWIIIVIALFHKAANQWPRVNGVKHSGFRVASTRHCTLLCSCNCSVGHLFNSHIAGTVQMTAILLHCTGSDVDICCCKREGELVGNGRSVTWGESWDLRSNSIQ